ncbi:MAG TPA: phosphotransferase family protein [Solirubrobacteraceae bacterium]|jgi:aminoglycoside phosphotransferase (APT) family kinase protein|nr:phosphotransferase family protein [Solirubrobacteraceae bacterium]
MEPDLDALARFMDEQGLGEGPIEDVDRLSGGTQNVMLRFTRAGRGYVLRRGPEHLRPHSNAAMRREIQVLRALGATDVPHPQLIADHPDGEVAYYLMEPVDGYSAQVTLPDRVRADPAERRAMGLAMADALGRLASVDHRAVGLGDVGQPEDFLERQIPRWLKEIERYRELDGYPGFAIPGVKEIVSWLQAHFPAAWTPGLMHGDFHLGNVMFAPDEPRIAAIVDWEMCTIGDPLLDLGWMIASWPGRAPALDRIAGELGAAGGLPDPDELVAAYAERSGRDVSQVEFYRVLACFKLGIVLEGTNARACAGKAPQAMGDRLHAMSVALFAQALEVIGWPPRAAR